MTIRPIVWSRADRAAACPTLRATQPRGSVLLPATIAGAWLIVIGAHVTGYAPLLHHHALIEDGPPLWIGVVLFALSWQVMIVAMMLPASLSAFQIVAERTASRSRPRVARATFLGAFAVVWTVFGLLAFSGDFVLHHLVDATPWLAARPWLVEASVLGLAGAYQFAPIKRRSLATCRHPGALVGTAPPRGGDAFRLGLDHGVTCLGASWALMLLMFAEGFANLEWMAALTAVMVSEVSGRHGELARRGVGIALLVVAALTVLSGPVLGGP